MREVFRIALCICSLSLLGTCENPTTESSTETSDKKIVSFAFLTVDNPFLGEVVLGFVGQDNNTIYITTSFPLPLNDFPLGARFTTTDIGR